MKNYFKNGEGMNFVFPIDGDCVNTQDGCVKDGVLYVNVRVSAEKDADVYINDIKAEYDGECFTAKIPVYGYRNTFYACDKNDTLKSAKVAVYRFDGAEGGYRISSDDNIIFLWDINKNKDKYKSIFENPYLAVYKKAHDLYGATVHLNIFYEFDIMDDFSEKRGYFNLSMMTDKFKDEWEANSDWLRLSFHARSNHPDMPYKNTDMKTITEDCIAVQREIIRFAGIHTLSDMTTVHWGECTIDGMRAVRAQGIKGAAGYFEFNPDGSTLVSYYYPDELVHHVGERDFWVDTDENLSYARIDAVLNLYKLDHIIPVMESVHKSPTRSGFMEIMIHEEYFYKDYMNYIPEFEQIVLTAAQWCKQHGYEGRALSQVMFEKFNTLK